MTYEYVCTTCNHQWEADQSIKDAPLKVCPSCKKQSAKRQISGGTGFVLKGGGWYSDLYSSTSSSSSKESAGSDSDGGSDTGSKAEKKDSSKAKKAEPKSKDGKSAA